MIRTNLRVQRVNYFEQLFELEEFDKPKKESLFRLIVIRTR